MLVLYSRINPVRAELQVIITLLAHLEAVRTLDLITIMRICDVYRKDIHLYDFLTSRLLRFEYLECIYCDSKANL